MALAGREGDHPGLYGDRERGEGGRDPREEEPAGRDVNEGEVLG